ncbi:DUF2280 domain-containing protein [Balneolales bacterium ANBcel1]|nr:DUF2280 domain-containing protein [Balneolales bacterium ANBcel1]
MAKLKNEHKLYIIKQLARFESLEEVKKALWGKYGIEVEYGHLSYYNPNNRSSRLSGELRTIFEEEREAFLNEYKEMPYSHREYRIKTLCEIAQKMEDEGQWRELANLIPKIDGIFERRGSESKTKDPDTFGMINRMIYTNR